MKTAFLFLFFLCLTACNSGSSSSDSSTSTEAGSSTPAATGVTSSNSTVPGFERWVAQMSEYGRLHCNTMLNAGNSYDQRLGATYYDAAWVFEQIREFTGDSSWSECIEIAHSMYRDGYVLDNGGQVPGYWNFSHGLIRHVERTGSSTSRSAIEALVDRAAFSNFATPLEWTLDDELSREVAYTIMTYLHARKLGLFYPEERLDAFVEQAFGHISQWLEGDAEYVRPFMVGLTSQALIEYHRDFGDGAVIPALQEILDHIWDRTWLPEQGSFQYTDREHESGGTEATPDLNMLIAPAYMWLAYQTGSQTAFERAEAIFAGGVAGAWLGGPKQFNQNYRWSFQYLRWREQVLNRTQ